MADYDGIWSRNGVNVEELPDPFAPAPPPQPPAETDTEATAPVPLAAGQARRLRRFGRAAADDRLAVRDRAAVAGAGAASRPGDAVPVAGGQADRPPRRDQGSAGRRREARAADPGRLRRDRGPALLSSLGDRPARDRPGVRRQHARRRRPPGRQHDHPATGQDQLPVVRPQPQAQGAGGDHRLLARRLADQGRNPLALPVERLFRRRRLRAARRVAPLFQPRSRRT